MRPVDDAAVIAGTPVVTDCSGGENGGSGGLEDAAQSPAAQFTMLHLPRYTWRMWAAR